MFVYTVSYISQLFRQSLDTHIEPPHARSEETSTFTFFNSGRRVAMYIFVSLYARAECE